MLAFIFVIISMLPFAITITFGQQNECREWTPIGITLPDLEGEWFVIAYVNETNADELSQTCVKQTFAYNAQTRASNESRTTTYPSSGKTETTYNEMKFTSPGVINETTYSDDTSYHYQNYFLEYTRGESFIFTNCVTVNGTLSINRLALFTREQYVDYKTIRHKFNSIGVELNATNVYHRVPQIECSG